MLHLLIALSQAADDAWSTRPMPPASPPPASWREKVPRDFRGPDWGVAWREAKSEAADDRRLYAQLAKWISLLTAGNSTENLFYWAEPPHVLREPRMSHPLEMLACQSDGRPRKHITAHRATQASCDAWWPTPCVAYIIGVGDEWSFPLKAATQGCVIHAYDPTAPLRQAHERFARRNNFSFHYLGLRGASTHNTFNSYGAVDGGMALKTLDGLAAANQPGEQQPHILSIDIEGMEWAAIEEWTRNPAAQRILSKVQYLYLDMHFHLRNPVTVRQFVHGFEFLFDKMGFRLRWIRVGDGYPADQKVVDFLGAAGLPAGLCCYESLLVRE
jgi:hypothetical protein